MQALVVETQVENENDKPIPPTNYHNVEAHFAELLSYQSVQRWLRKKADATKAEYLLRFQGFLVWTKSRISVETPDQLLAWARGQPDGLAVQDLVDQFAETKTQSAGQISVALVRSFLGRNGLPFVLPKIDWAPTMSFTEGYKRADVLGLLSYLDGPFEKLYVYAAVDSGLRSNDLLYLRYKHVAEDLEANQQYVAVRFEKERYLRRKAAGRAFLGPNTLKLLNQLINSGKIRRDPDARIFPFAYRTITKVLNYAKMKAGLNSEIQPNHGLRKFFENNLDRVGMDRDKKMQLEGHSAGVRNAYTSRDIEELRKLYGEAYRFLDLSESSVVSNEMKSLQAKILEQEKTIDSLKAKGDQKDQKLERVLSELATIRSQIAEMKSKSA